MRALRWALAASWVLLLPTGWAQSAQAEECAGVQVVVEARDVPGGASGVGCASAPSSGIDALRQAGFSVTLGTGGYGGGFICAISAAPATGCAIVDDDTYWSYWYQKAGSSSWIYSSLGAASRRPQPGEVEAWVWQSGGAVEPPSPRVRPAAPVSPKSSITPTPRQASSVSSPAGRATGSSIRTSATPDAPTQSAGSAAARPPSIEDSAGTAAPGASRSRAAVTASVENSTPGSLAAVAPVVSRSTARPWSGWWGAAGLLLAVVIGVDLARRLGWLARWDIRPGRRL